MSLGRLELSWQDYVEVVETEGRSNDVSGFRADISKAKSALNWEPKTSATEWVAEIQDFCLKTIG